MTNTYNKEIIIKGELSLNHWEKQLILYTKGHYESVPQETILPLLASELYDLHIWDVESYSVYNMVEELFDLLVSQQIIKYSMSDFISNTFKYVYDTQVKSEITRTDIITQMLFYISKINVKEKELDLGKLDIDFYKRVSSIAAKTI